MMPARPASPDGANQLVARLVEQTDEYALIILDASGRITSWNAGASRLFSYGADEAIGKHVALLYPTDAVAREEPQRHLDEARRGGVWRAELTLASADATKFVAAATLRALTRADGELQGYGLSARATAADRPAALDRERAATQLYAIQRVTDVGLARLPFEGLMSALLERVAEVLAADTVVVLLKDGDALLAVAAIGLEEEVEQQVRVPLGAGFAGRVATGRRYIIVDDVSQYPVVNPILRQRGVQSLLGVPLMVEGDVRGVLHVGSLAPRAFTEEEAELLQVVADRVALALAHARLAEAEQEARMEAATAAATARLREQFLGITAHELKTPLTVVNGYALMLQRALTRGTLDAAVLRPAVDEIATQASRLDRLINDLLETSRVHEGRLTLDPEPMDLSRLARDVARRFSEGPEASPAHTVIVDAPEPVIGEWDVSRLDQVVTNLVSNAIKYSPRGGPVTIRVRPREGSGAVLSVEDGGVGIPAHAQRDLFKPFSRPVGGNDRRGIGLGLFLASQFVQRHGGTITVRSEAGEGSTFTVELPPRAPAGEEIEPASPE